MVVSKHLSALLWAVSLVVAPVLSATPTPRDFTAAQIEKGDALTTLAQLAYDNTGTKATAATTAERRKSRRAGCSAANVRVRREWRTMTKAQRKSYIAAVQCLRSKPSLLDPVAFPAAKSLFDDFVVIHLQQTLNIHLTGTFLTWHRYFVWAYEEKLRTACGYTGPLPYWEWGFDVNNPSASPVFDGSDTSMGGNGQFFSHAGMQLTLNPFDPSNVLTLPPGNGGGCVTTGPFANMVVHLGPVALAQYGTPVPSSVPDPLNDHPRCLKRDLNAGVAKRWTTFLNTTLLILSHNNIEQFQAHLQGDPRYVTNELGVHGGGHFTIGGDPGSDPFISPGDPAFYLHHAQVDRVYWVWQLLDFPNRKDVFGTQTFMDLPPSPNITLNDIIDISPLAPPVKVGDLMDTLGGSPLCYVYL